MKVAHPRAPLLAVSLIYLAWTFATWWLEGRVETFLRPDAVRDRLVYALVANLGMGLAGGLAVALLLVRRGRLLATLAGFSGVRRGLVAATAGFGLGLGAYFAQGAPSAEPVVLLNAYAQALTVSAAEVVVCWVLVGGVVLSLGGDSWRARIAAALVASVLFGLYHFAHSPPFNSWSTVALLTGVGLVTSVFFLVSRDVVGTVLFHNWLGVLGIVGALEEAGALGAFSVPQPPLLAMATVTLAVLAVGAWTVRRTAERR